MANLKKIMITASLILLFSVIYSSIVFGYYRDDFWECTRSGEKSEGDFFGRLPNSGLYDSQQICTKSCCILCVSRSPIRNCFGGDQKPMCGCTQGSSTDLTAPELTVNNPVEGSVYEKRGIEFNLASSERAKMEYLDNKDPRRGYRLLCKQCTSYNRKINFKEGLNDITIKATDLSNNIDEKRITFAVDSKAPKISKVEPKNGNYVNGVFKVFYYEENLKKVNLLYRNGINSNYNLASTNECQSGKKQSCEIVVNNLQDGELFYYFEIEDIAGAKAVSREQKVFVDTINPVIILDPSLTSGVNTYDEELPLSLSVSENVKLEYKDLNDQSLRFKRLCSNCNSYNKNIDFGEGTHNIVIMATDKAGNFDEESLVFNIV